MTIEIEATGEVGLIELRVGLICDYINPEIFDAIERSFHQDHPQATLQLSCFTHYQNNPRNFDIVEVRSQHVSSFIIANKAGQWNLPNQPLSSDLNEFSRLASNFKENGNVYGIAHHLEGLHYITIDPTLANASSIDDLVMKLSKNKLSHTASLASYDLQGAADLGQLSYLSFHQDNNSPVKLRSNFQKLAELCQNIGNSRCFDTDPFERHTIESDLFSGKLSGLIVRDKTVQALQTKYPNRTFYASTLPVGSSNGQFFFPTLFIKNQVCKENCDELAFDFVKLINQNATLSPGIRIASLPSAGDIKQLSDIALFELSHCNSTRSQKVNLDDLDIYYINLDRSPERRVFMESQLDAIGLKYKRFPAVDGYNVTLIDTKTNVSYSGLDLKNMDVIVKNRPYQVICPGLADNDLYYTQKDKAALRRMLSPGEFGIYCSSRKLWQEIVAADRNNPVLILEDDVTFLKPFVSSKAEIQKLFSALPARFDVIYPYKHEWTNAVLSSWGEIIQEQKAPCANKNFIQLTSIHPNQGLVAQIITKHTAKKYLTESRQFNSSIDCHINHYIEKVAYVTTIPMVNSTSKDDSVITKMLTDRIDVSGPTVKSRLGEILSIKTTVRPHSTTSKSLQSMESWLRYRDHFYATENLRCLEIGGYDGMASYYIASSFCNAPTARLDCIYTHNSFEHYKSNMADYIKAGLVNPIQGHLTSALIKFGGDIETERSPRYSFIFVDQLATNKTIDLALAWELLELGGIMIIDNNQIPASSFLREYNSTYFLLAAGQQTHIVKTAIEPSFLQLSIAQTPATLDSYKLATYVINLDRSPERYMSVKKQLDKMQVRHERFSAVDGIGINVIDIASNATVTGSEIRNGWKFTENKYYLVNCMREKEINFVYFWDPSVLDRPLNVGELGFFCSTRSLWHKISTTAINDAWILEDDVKFKTEYLEHGASLNDKARLLPTKYDIIFSDRRPRDTLEPNNGGYYFKVTKPFYGTYSYVVSPVGARNLLVNSVKVTWPVDDHIARLIENGQIAAYSNDFARLEHDYSFDSTIAAMGNRAVLKLKLANCWPDQGFNRIPMFKEILEESFTVQLVNDSNYHMVIDRAIFHPLAINQDRNLAQNSIKVFYTEEAEEPKFEGYDLSVAYKDVQQENYLRAPYYYMAYTSNITTPIDRGQCNPNKERFACFLVSSSGWGNLDKYTGVKARDEFFTDLSAYKFVHSGGKHLNNIGRVVPQNETVSWLSECKFVIAYENQKYPHYITEKPFQAYIAGAIPLYYGHSSAFNDINKAAVVYVDDYSSNQELINDIKLIDQDDKLYCTIWNRPLLTDPNKNYSIVKAQLKSKLNEQFIKKYKLNLDRKDLRVATQTPFPKPRLKVGHYNQYAGFKPEQNKIIYEVLKEDFDLVIDKIPDLAISGPFGSNPLPTSAIKLFYTGEAIRPQIDKYDLAFGFDHIDSPNYMRLPLYYMYYNISTSYDKGECNPHKERFACFLVSGDGWGDLDKYTGCRERDRLFRELSEYKRVDSGGKHLNNIGYLVPGNETNAWLSQCKFVIAYENQLHDGYITEKPFQAYFAGSIPIYYASDSALRDINLKAVINSGDFASNKELIERIKILDQDDKLYCDIWNQQLITDQSKNYLVVKEQLRAKLHQVIDSKLQGKKLSQPVQERRAISYGLYGNNTKYTHGALRNAELASKFYPGWDLLFFVDKATVPENITSGLQSRGAKVLTDMPFSDIMCGRFLVADMTYYDRFIIRDVDSRPGQREAEAVNDWIKSGKKMHNIRDHQEHNALIMGGLWGGTRNLLNGKKMEDLLNIAKHKDFGLKQQDQIFLAKTIYPLVGAENMLSHDSYFCKSYSYSIPFPSPKPNGLVDFIGQVYLFKNEVEIAEFAPGIDAPTTCNPKTVVTSVQPDTKNGSSQTHFCIVAPSYNNRNYTEQHLKSIITQENNNWRMIYIDDNSNDGTSEFVAKIKKDHSIDDNKIKLINNPQRAGSPVRSIYYAAHHFCQDQEVMLVVDGDDALAPLALSKLADVYSNNTVWMTYGQYIIIPDGNLGLCRELSAAEWKNLRKSPWVTSHLRTSYTWLFKKIRVQDLQRDGNFLQAVGDMATMFPMLEMSGSEHVRYIAEIMYLYRHHGNNEYIVRHTQAVMSEQYIRSLPRYQKLFESSSIALANQLD